MADVAVLSPPPTLSHTQASVGVGKFNNIAQCTNFFQQAILRTIHYWQEHEAVQQTNVSVLDRERETILNMMQRGLEFDAAWPSLKPLLIAFASYMERRGHWAAWRGVMEKAITVAREHGDRDGEITLTALLARLSQRQSRGPEVVRFYARVIRLAKQAGNRYEEARACSNLGYYYIDGGHWWRSEVLSCHALELFEALKSKHGLAHTHNHLGVLYTRQARFAVAEQHLAIACQLWEEMGDEHGIINGLLNLGLLFLQMKHAKAALVPLKKAVQKSQMSGEEVTKATILLNIGYAYQEMKEFKAALNYNRAAETLYQKFGDILGLARVQNNLGFITYHQGHYEEAGCQLLHALSLFRQRNNKEGEANALGNLIECQIAQGNLQAAAAYIRQAESLFNEWSYRPAPQDLARLAEYRDRLTLIGESPAVAQSLSDRGN